MAATPLNFYRPSVMNYLDVGNYRFGGRWRKLGYYPPLNARLGLWHSGSNASSQTIGLVFHLI